MSPLVRSLLALAALLAAAQAQSNCVDVMEGNESPVNVRLAPLQVQPPGEELELPSKCPGAGVMRYQTGVKVHACNNDDNLPPPNVTLSGYWLVSVRCHDDDEFGADCPDGVTVDVTEYCFLVPPPAG